MAGKENASQSRGSRLCSSWMIGSLLLLLSFSAGAQSRTAGTSPAQALARGKAYYSGQGIPQDAVQAVQWFSAAAAAGSMEAQAWLGDAYLEGRGVSPDLAKAASLIQTAAVSGDPVGLRFLGVMYQTGQGLDRNYEKALEAYSSAAAKNDANSFDRLGILYLRGLGVKQDVSKAATFFTKGASLGDSWAQLNLGELYQNGRIHSANSTTKNPGVTAPTTGKLPGLGEGTPELNRTMAIALFKQSAAQGNRVAAFELGEIYLQGTNPDISAAAPFLRQAASARYAPAQVAIGQILESGQGVPVDLVHAYMWYSLAVGQGSQDANVRLQSLMAKMTSQEIEAGESALAAVTHK